MPHILHSAFQIIEALFLAIVTAGGIVAVLMSPVMLGSLIGNKGSRLLQAIILPALALVSVSGIYWLYQSFASKDPSYVAMALTFVPMYMGMGLYLGRENKSRHEQNERRLANWQNQLAADRQAGASSARLAADYREIAALLKRLGRGEEAADEYRHALILLEATFGGHPSMADYYQQYLAYLGKAQAEETTRITAKLSSLPKL
jgi:hypothetical protein